jgi:hypothetical protein
MYGMRVLTSEALSDTTEFKEHEMATAEALRTLTKEEMSAILDQPNGPHLLLQYCRDGRVDPEEAARAIDRYQNTPWQVVKRFFLAVIWSILGR